MNRSKSPGRKPPGHPHQTKGADHHGKRMGRTAAGTDRTVSGAGGESGSGGGTVSQFSGDSSRSGYDGRTHQSGPPLRTAASPPVGTGGSGLCPGDGSAGKGGVLPPAGGSGETEQSGLLR